MSSRRPTRTRPRDADLPNLRRGRSSCVGWPTRSRPCTTPARSELRKPSRVASCTHRTRRQSSIGLVGMFVTITAQVGGAPQVILKGGARRGAAAVERQEALGQRRRSRFKERVQHLIPTAVAKKARQRGAPSAAGAVQKPGQRQARKPVKESPSVGEFFFADQGTDGPAGGGAATAEGFQILKQAGGGAGGRNKNGKKAPPGPAACAPIQFAPSVRRPTFNAVAHAARAVEAKRGGGAQKKTVVEGRVARGQTPPTQGVPVATGQGGTAGQRGERIPEAKGAGTGVTPPEEALCRWSWSRGCGTDRIRNT